MGAKNSKNKLEISGTPKKGGDAGQSENGDVEGRLERLEEGDVMPVKATQNGTAAAPERTEVPSSSPVTEEAQPVLNGDSNAEPADKKEETEEAKSEEKTDESLVNGAESPENKDKSADEAAATPEKDKKKKDKSKKKWSFRSISFSRKDKSKPNLSKDDAKNGSITKEEPVAEVVEAEAAATTEAIPIKDDEPKKDEAPVSTEEKDEKKEATSAETPSVEASSPVPAPVEPTTAPAPVPEPVETPAPTPAPEPVETPPPVPVPEPVQEPVVVPAPAPVEEATPEPVVEKVEDVAIPEPVLKPEAVLEEVLKTEVKVEELPPPLPASPPPTEAPPPTPVAPTPASIPEPVETDVSHAEVETQEIEVVGGGGESMADLVEVEPVLDTEEKEEIPAAPLVNGISDHSHDFEKEICEKVEIVADNFKNIVTESIISTQVTETSEDKSEQTASAAD